jgi:hypothetical protein
MVGEKTTLEILWEIQQRLKDKGYPVKIDLSEPIEGADIGLELIVSAEKNWQLEKSIIHEIFEVLDRYGLIPSLEWKWV